MMIKPELLYSDIFFFVFILGLALFFFWARRREYYRQACGRIVSNKRAVFFFAVVCLYGLIALLDSTHYREALRQENGAALKDKDGYVVYGQMTSLLDLLFLKSYSGIKQDGEMAVNLEKSYSKPFADKSFDPVYEMDEATGKMVSVYEGLKKPLSHILGTDKAGGDLFYKLVKGIRTAIIVGLVTTMIVIPFAIFFGILSGYFGGRIDDLIQFFYITLGSIPAILLISGMMIIVRAKITAVTASDVYLRDDSIVLFLCAILGLVGWSGLCRLLRAETIKIKELDYVKAAKAMGVNDFVIIGRHILPNVLHVILITSILQFSGLVMVEAILAYIRIGVPSTVESWGRIVDGARAQLGRDPIIWWPVLGAFFFMFLLVLSINVFGDALRDALDPKLRS
ncbi:ABC transporter permease [bacterium]|nr:ABC transporter permease [bacterium]